MRERPRLPGAFERSGCLRLTLSLIACAPLLGGCVVNGDFDRLRPELVTDGIHDWVGRDAVVAAGGAPSEFRLSDDERRLRDLAYPLIAPPYDRNRWDSVLREYGLRHRPLAVAADRAVYWRKLGADERRSEASGYAQIATDARNDVDRIEPFFAVAGRVIDLDDKRARSLAHVAGLTRAESVNAVNRNAENDAVVRWVCRSLRARAASYRFALERMVIVSPSPMAAETDRMLNLLAMRSAMYCHPASAVVVAKD